MSFTKHYIQLQYSNGSLYEYSKVEKEGFSPHENTKGDISYRKYYKSIDGVLESVSKYTNEKYENKGAEVVLDIKNGEDVYKVQLSLFSPKGQVTQFVESLITLLPNLSKGDNISFRAYNFKPADSVYDKVGVSIKKDGVKVERALKPTYKKDGVVVQGDIPMLEWVEKFGKKRPTALSVETKEDYLQEQLEKQLERLGFDGNGLGGQPEQTSAPKENNEPKKEEVKKPTKKAVQVDISQDDSGLPF